MKDWLLFGNMTDAKHGGWLDFIADFDTMSEIEDYLAYHPLAWNHFVHRNTGGLWTRFIDDISLPISR